MNVIASLFAIVLAVWVVRWLVTAPKEPRSVWDCSKAPLGLALLHRRSRDARFLPKEPIPERQWKKSRAKKSNVVAIGDRATK